MEQSDILTKAEQGMAKATETLKSDFLKMRTGRATPSILDNVKVDAYGSQMPLNQVATLAAPEARLITVNPFDKTQLGAIEKAILVSGLGLTPNNDGKIIRVPIPALSEERRKDLAKQIKKQGEDSKVSIRHHRQEANQVLKKEEKNSDWTEDDIRKTQELVQKMTDKFVKVVDELVAVKEKEILNV